MDSINVWWPQRPPPGNFGDILTPLLLKELFGVEANWVNKPFENTTLIGIGSIITHANANCVVWGSGLMSTNGPLNTDAKYLSVRGPRTHEMLIKSEIECPPVYGDPALLLPTLYHPKIEKEYEYGIFAHYVDTVAVTTWYNRDKNINIIDPLNADPLKVADEVLKCKHIISSSLHGIIIAHAYGIPAVWVRHSNKLNGDGIKFQDYYDSVGLSAECVEFTSRLNPTKFSELEYTVDIDIDVNPIKDALSNYLKSL